jgi:hypothetical protein
MDIDHNKNSNRSWEKGNHISESSNDGPFNIGNKIVANSTDLTRNNYDGTSYNRSNDSSEGGPLTAAAITRVNMIRFTLLQLYVYLMNNIIIPSFAVATISTNCFYELIIPSSEVSSTYVYNDCILYTNVQNSGKCIAYADITGQTSYHPPFSYSYVCSSEFVKDYGATLVYVGMMITFLKPIGLSVLLYFYRKASPESRIYRLIDQSLPMMYKPYDCIRTPTTTTTTTTTIAAAAAAAADLHSISSKASSDNDKLSKQLPFAQSSTNPSIVSYISTNDLSINHASDLSIDTSIDQSNTYSNHKASGIMKHHPDFTIFADQLLVSLLGLVGILMSYGVVFPPLGAVSLLALVSSLWVYKIVVGRFICITSKYSSNLFYINQISKELNEAGDPVMIQNCMWVIIFISFSFYTLFIFDSFGDELGFKRSYWILIVVPFIPLGLYLIVVVTRSIRQQRQQQQQLSTSSSFVVREDHTDHAAVDVNGDGPGESHCNDVRIVVKSIVAPVVELSTFIGGGGRTSSPSHDDSVTMNALHA